MLSIRVPRACLQPLLAVRDPTETSLAGEHTPAEVRSIAATLKP